MKKRIALLFGGKSAEHDVSVLSAKAIYEHIDKDLFDVKLVGIDMDGGMFLFDDNSFLNQDKLKFDENNKFDFSEFTSFLKNEIDVVFPALHGPYGEDGKIQGFLDFIDVPYVGCNHLCSAICMDKAYNKHILQDNDFNIIPFEVILKHDFVSKENHLLDDITKRLGSNLFVKPANMGSSVGVSKSTNREELMNAINLSFKYDDVAVVEKAINAAEYECGVFGLNDFKATPVGEIKPSHEFYDYEAKYSEDAVSEIEIPAKLSEEDAKYIQNESVRAAKLFRIRGLSRMDFLMDKDSGEIYISEINTMPGFTQFSMYPSLVEKIGITYTDLITNLIELADK